MTLQGWFVFFLVLNIIHFIGTWRLYVKAGRKAWEAAIPVYNAVVLMDIINRPKWWVILLFLPVINLFMFPVIWVETIRSFGRNSRPETFLVILTLGFYIYYVNYVLDVKYIEDRSLKPRSSAGEWVSSIVFAVIAATLVHTYFMQPMLIPSSSLEKSLLVGDFLFVSKFHYGSRVPMTTVAAPMVHDTIPSIPVPFTKKKIRLNKAFKSYLFNDDFENKNYSWKNKLQLPYMRLPAFQKIKRNDIVVFNQPADTLLDMNQFKPDRNYYKPIDKKTNLVKRCVGLPGDSLEIRDGYVFINGKKNELPDRAHPQYNFTVNTGGQAINESILRSRYNVREGYIVASNGYYHLNSIPKNIVNYNLTLTDDEAALLSKNPTVKSVEKNLFPNGMTDPDIFPHVPGLGWNMDNFGPIFIPKKGATVKLDKQSLPFYKRIISEYERNNLIVNGDEIMINGKITNEYTFKQDYYWMMGDNRQNSIDARRWGYVPFDHVVGKPVFIWFSWDSNETNIVRKLKSIRWDRVFTTVGGEGKRVSYFPYFVGLVIVWLAYNKYRKLKKG